MTWGLALVPVTGTNRWLTPVALAGPVFAGLLVWRCSTAARPLVDLRAWVATARQVDVVGATLLAIALGGVILAFGTADPQHHVFAEQGPWLLLTSFLLGRRGRVRTTEPALTAIRCSQRGPSPWTPAWGALVVSFFVGAALVAALVDIPIFARLTVHQDDQVAAAMVLVRFLVGLPAGALLGGWLTHRLPAGVVTAVGMAVSCAGFGWMATWGLTSLDHAIATVPLVLAGLGIGLAMAPVNAALLAATDDPVHGVASGLLVVARTVGKLVGISALTTIGLRRFYATERGLPAPGEVCSGGRTRCAEWTLILREAGLTQLHTIFVGAAICCAVAGVVALVVFRHCRHPRCTGCVARKPAQLRSAAGRAADDVVEPRGHLLRQRFRCAKRADHDHEVIDQPVVVGTDEVAAGDRLAADLGLEHECMVARGVVADLPHVAEVIEDLDDGGQDGGGDGLAGVRLERDRTGEDDVVGEERGHCFDVAGFDRFAERMHARLPKVDP